MRAVLTLLLAAATLPAASQTPTRTLLRTGHLLDVTHRRRAHRPDHHRHRRPHHRHRPHRLHARQPGDREIDLTKYTVLPGLIDVHTHLTMDTNFDPYYELSMTPAKEAIIGVENAKVTLEAGFTTVRNVGANDYTDVALRDEINAGHIPGPHMQVSGPALGITGGHMDENLLPFEYHVTRPGRRRRHPRRPAQGPRRTSSTAPTSSRSAPPAACSPRATTRRPRSTPSRRCRPSSPTPTASAAKSPRTPTARRPSSSPPQAGVDSIEHGSYINDEDIALMKKHGTYLVPTAYLIRLVQGARHPSRRSTSRR